MTHAAMISGKYETFLANDLQGFGLRLFRDAISGKCNGRWREWVSREEFNAKKNTDALIALCWSFSNNGRDYLYSKNIESQKKTLHEQVVNCGSYAEWKNGKTHRDSHNNEREIGIERLEALERDYCEIEITADDVVYCDPPYANTQRYNTKKFDSLAFWDWVRSKPFPIFVSEYHAPDDFTPIWSKLKSVLMNQHGSDGKVREFLFVEKRFADRFQTDLFGNL